VLCYVHVHRRASEIYRQLVGQRGFTTISKLASLARVIDAARTDCVKARRSETGFEDGCDRVAGGRLHSFF